VTLIFALIPPPPPGRPFTAGKLVTRCAEPYAEGDLVTVQLDMDAPSRHIAFYKNGVLQGAGDGLPGGCWRRPGSPSAGSVAYACVHGCSSLVLA
jgi:hypothetical protein